MSDTLPEATRRWLADLGLDPQDNQLWLRALTHGSADGNRNYERLEFVGDRVLGLAIARWLYDLEEAREGELAQRLNALVSRQTCAAVARRIGVAEHMRLGKQAREDGGADSDNILGDVMEALLGAALMDHGFQLARDFVRREWGDAVNSDAGRAKHPKSALQEWAAANRRKPPEYQVLDRSGPDHSATFTVQVAINKVGVAQATAGSKQEAETAAARAFMERYG